MIRVWNAETEYGYGYKICTDMEYGYGIWYGYGIRLQRPTCYRYGICRDAEYGYRYRCRYGYRCRCRYGIGIQIRKQNTVTEYGYRDQLEAAIENRGVSYE